MFFRNSNSSTGRKIERGINAVGWNRKEQEETLENQTDKWGLLMCFVSSVAFLFPLTRTLNAVPDGTYYFPWLWAFSLLRQALPVDTPKLYTCTAVLLAWRLILQTIKRLTGSTCTYKPNITKAWISFGFTALLPIPERWQSHSYQQIPTKRAMPFFPKSAMGKMYHMSLQKGEIHSDCALLKRLLTTGPFAAIATFNAPFPAVMELFAGFVLQNFLETVCWKQLCVGVWQGKEAKPLKWWTSHFSQKALGMMVCDPSISDILLHVNIAFCHLTPGSLPLDFYLLFSWKMNDNVLPSNHCWTLFNPILNFWKAILARFSFVVMVKCFFPKRWKQ